MTDQQGAAAGRDRRYVHHPMGRARLFDIIVFIETIIFLLIIQNMRGMTSTGNKQTLPDIQPHIYQCQLY